MNFIEKIKNQIKELFEDTALTVDHDTTFLYPGFDYYGHYKSFFTYMKTSGYAEYKTADFLKDKINEFGDLFANDYKSAVNSDVKFKKLLDKRVYIDFDEQVANLKLKYCGNLFEALSIIYFVAANPLNGFSFKEWTNGGDDDANGCDGTLVMNDNKNVVIPINAKHVTHLKLSKFAPYQKLECWTKQQLVKNRANSDTVMTYLNLPFTGIIITDFIASDFTQEKFPQIKVINGNDLHKALGNVSSANITKNSIWQKVESFL